MKRINAIFVTDLAKIALWQIAAICLVLLAAQARADDQLRENTLSVGAGAIAGARYSGADQNHVSPGLVIDYSMANGFFASTKRGIGYEGSGGFFAYSFALGYRPGRKDRNVSGLSGDYGSEALAGMGKIRGSMIVLPSIRYELGKRLQLGIQAEIPVSERDNGASVQFGLSSPVYTSSNDELTIGLAGNWGDHKYMQTYYGVSAAQATSSGFRSHTPKSGIFAYTAEIGWKHNFSREWNLMTSVGVARLTGGAADSPIVKRRSAPVGSIFVTYSY